MPYIHWRTIIFGDTDAAAIVYTPRFANFCMEAAEVWFKERIGIDWYVINTRQHMGTPVVHMSFDLLAPLIAGDRLGTAIRVLSLGKSSLTLEFEGVRMRDNDQTAAFRAKIVYCFVDTTTNRAIAIPEVTAERIRTYQHESEPVSKGENPGTKVRLEGVA